MLHLSYRSGVSRGVIQQIESKSPSYVPSEGNTAFLARALRVAALSRGDTVVGTARRSECLYGLIREAPEDRAHALSLDLTGSEGMRQAVEILGRSRNTKRRSGQPER